MRGRGILKPNSGVTPIKRLECGIPVRVKPAQEVVVISVIQIMERLLFSWM